VLLLIVLLIVLLVWIVPAILGAQLGYSRLYPGALGVILGFLIGGGFSWLGVGVMALFPKTGRGPLVVRIAREESEKNSAELSREALTDARSTQLQDVKESRSSRSVSVQPSQLMKFVCPYCGYSGSIKQPRRCPRCAQEL
jgi:predicted Zn-ribbon and HTH transcriptional regulator